LKTTKLLVTGSNGLIGCEKVAELLKPLADRRFERGVKAIIVKTDATGLKVLDPSASTCHAISVTR